MQPPDPFILDRRAVRAHFERASATYDAAAVVQTRVREELLSRLDLIRLAPQVVVDLGCGTGLGTRALKDRYRAASVIGLDLAPGMLREARRRGGWLRPLQRVCADVYQLPFRDGAVELMFSNLMLQWCDDLDGALREVRRVLAPGGFFAFSTFGPDTLRELRQAWAAADGGTHVSGFRDMHDIGDAVTRAGLAEPVMDVERLTLVYPDVAAISRDLKVIGARNATAARSRGLTGKGRWRAMTEAYETLRQAGLLPATYEVVYGAAWGALGRPAMPAIGGEVHIPVHVIRRRREI
ncbi:MAG TPA: malonyl-ACP O-methyltransferase BioC [Steroidobacteraceae bacterium]|jgi:malonyl-CoA O-methyltransferase|nr:malonyl-ACP O-methyltransferase BioC [Steroidobacteraceae bacterium]